MNLIAKESMAQNKLQLLYLFNMNIKRPGEQVKMEEECEPFLLTELQIMRITDELDFMHYFDLKETLFELKESKHIETHPTPQGALYGITESGRNIIQVLSEDLHLSSRTALTEYIEENFKELQKESQYISEYLKLGTDEYRVTLRVLEKNITIFEVNIIVYSKEQARSICENWKDSAVEIYKDLMIKLS